MIARSLAILFFGLAVFGGLTSGWNFRLAIAQEAQKEIWTCPMHPQIIRNEPGNCPICGMRLVKREIEKPKPAKPSVVKPNAPKPLPTTSKISDTIPKGHASFQLSLERQQMIGVKIGVVEKGPLFKLIRTAGRLAFDPELYNAQNEFIEALRQAQRMKHSTLPEAAHSAERMVESSLFRLKVLGLSDEEIARIQSSRKADSGLLIGRSGTDAWIYADVYEMDLPDIRAGLSVEISAAFLAGQTVNGTVSSIDRVIDPTTRTAKARILVSKAPANLRPQSFVDVAIRAPLGEQVSVPLDAVLDTGTQAWVFLTDGEGHFEPRLVAIRAYAGNRVAIASGLKGGEKIVTSANFLIDSESRLRATSEETSDSDGTKTPRCPESEYWDTGMSMCMPKVGS